MTAAAIALLPAVVSAQPCPGGRLLLFTNGKIHTVLTRLGGRVLTAMRTRCADPH